MALLPFMCLNAASFAQEVNPSSLQQILQALQQHPQQEKKAGKAKKLCTVSNYFKANGCAPGDFVAFLPPSFGNDQLPISFIKDYCDFDEQIVMNRSGVICTVRSQIETYSGDEKFDWNLNRPQREAWEKFFKETVLAADSQWVQVNDKMYKKVLREGPGVPLQAPVRLLETYQKLDWTGVRLDKPFNETSDEAPDSKSTYLQHHDGTVLEVIWINKDDMAKTERYEVTLTIKPDAKPAPKKRK
jgi:hypothetical protein